MADDEDLAHVDLSAAFRGASLSCETPEHWVMAMYGWDIDERKDKLALFVAKPEHVVGLANGLIEVIFSHGYGQQLLDKLMGTITPEARDLVEGFRQMFAAQTGGLCVTDADHVWVMRAIEPDGEHYRQSLQCQRCGAQNTRKLDKLGQPIEEACP